MGDPRIGMYQSEVKKRVKRLSKDGGDHDGKGAQVRSLINQAELHEKGSGMEVAKEMISMNGSSKSRGNYQCNIEFCSKCKKVQEYCTCKEEKDEKDSSNTTTR